MDGGSSDDYYALLGVDARADATELRRAWRRLALRWHPDRAGVGATATFQKISAAYAVLSNPTARGLYDRRRRAMRSPGMRSGDATSAPPTSASPAAASRRDAPGVLLRRLSAPLNALLACGVARRAEPGVIELFLNAQEASEGGMITISMRVPIRCPACAADATAPCARCGTQRSVDELFSAWLAVPPGVADGTVLMPSALLNGMVRPVSFRVRRL
jgi:DnaJ-class molecular chaperone